MSGVIRDVEKLNQKQLQTARKRNEREIRSLDNAHQDYKAELKKTHQSEIVEIKNAHHGQISQAAEKKEKVLGEIKSNLNKTNEITEKELKALKTNAEQEKIENQRKLSHDRERINSEHDLYLDELNDRFNTQAKKVNYDGKQRVDVVKTSLQEELVNTEEFYETKINDKNREFKTRFTQDELNNRLIKDNQDKQFKNERLRTNQNQQFQLKKMTETHDEHIQKRDDDFRVGLKDQDLFFEKKYADQLNRHNGEFKTLETKNKNLLESLKSGLASEITKVSSKNDDPFFKFHTLNPKLKEFEDRVEVSVEIPEHSKQDVALTINGKDAILTFNRRYNDATKSMDGTINKINKVETFTSRVATSHILDAKSVKSSYEDGIMNYTIKRS